MQQKPSKYFVMKRIEEMVVENPAIRILDIGSGKSGNFGVLLKKFPNLSYTGIEPNVIEARFAKEMIKKFPNARIINDLAYAPDEINEQFDLVVSLSVLEHVKDLARFMEFAFKALISKGHFIHLYDLGHALYPSSLKEKIQVDICNNKVLSRFVPEIKFTAYIKYEDVKCLIEASGGIVNDTTYHNMNSHVGLLKKLPESKENEQILETITDLEVLWSRQVGDIHTRERLFPALCFWGIKK